MQIHTKARYGLAVMLLLAKESGKTVPLNTIASRLGISKIYLEQVLSILKTNRLVSAIKGPAGGYSILNPDQLSVYDILNVLEPQLSSQSENDFKDPALNALLNAEVYLPLSRALGNHLESIRIVDLAYSYNENPMYYI